MITELKERMGTETIIIQQKEPKLDPNVRKIMQVTETGSLYSCTFATLSISKNQTGQLIHYHFH